MDQAFEAGTGTIYRLWPQGAPGSEHWDWSERTAQIPWTDRPRRYTRNVVDPTLTVWRPEPGKANGTAVIVAPGGAFHFLMVDHEGDDMARWLTGLGVTAFVLKYRLERTPDDDAAMLDFRTELHKRLAAVRQSGSMGSSRDFLHKVREMGEEDGRQAIRFVREHAAEWGLDSQRIGIAGFSAGGGVALGPTMTHDAASRPDFSVCIYAAPRQAVSVPENPPPLFLVISDDDPQVPPLSAPRLYQDWHTAGGKAELHVFGNGGHGYGMDQAGWLSDIWPELLRRWMAERGLLPG